MQINLKTILINGEDPDPKVFTIGFGEWPRYIPDLNAGLSMICDIYSEGFEDFSLIIQAPPDNTTVYINANGTILDDGVPYVMSELWEITPDETPV